VTSPRRVLHRGIEFVRRQNRKAFFAIHFAGKGWSHYYRFGNLSHRDMYEITASPTEADARAKMLIYLIENKLIEV
jgi:hypothetical protein